MGVQASVSATSCVGQRGRGRVEFRTIIKLSVQASVSATCRVGQWGEGWANIRTIIHLGVQTSVSAIWLVDQMGGNIRPFHRACRQVWVLYGLWERNLKQTLKCCIVAGVFSVLFLPSLSDVRRQVGDEIWCEVRSWSLWIGYKNEN